MDPETRARAKQANPKVHRMTIVSPETIEFLKTVDTPTICNALEIVAPERRLIGYTVKPFVCPFPDVVAVVGYARVATCRATHPNELTGEAARNQRIGYYEYIASGPGPTHCEPRNR